MNSLSEFRNLLCAQLIFLKLLDFYIYIYIDISAVASLLGLRRSRLREILANRDREVASTGNALRAILH